MRVKRILHIWIIDSTKLEKKDTENPQSIDIYTKKSTGCDYARNLRL